MRAKKVPETVEIPRPEEQRGRLRSIGGSDNDDFCNILANQVVSSWRGRAFRLLDDGDSCRRSGEPYSGFRPSSTATSSCWRSSR